jgi:hypothetical protein
MLLRAFVDKCLQRWGPAKVRAATPAALLQRPRDCRLYELYEGEAGWSSCITHSSLMPRVESIVSGCIVFSTSFAALFGSLPAIATLGSLSSYSDPCSRFRSRMTPTRADKA